ncbi:helix-turn-helix domain-containing protein [Halorubellus sp. PRR65]|uniref:TrmB family transcriptional regulator n=1 Tax=Halorubellus sp. PRR65 TaxID=3098148 RepID=UPI002B25DFA5|nr:helix-turn-helix domain-containing protein [Halorubellus sp. PRR65]
MEEAEAVGSLERLGLTSYEAKVFIALQKLGSGTAREVSRVADVPRSQVYSVTESLEERGLVEVQQSSPMQYRPVRIEEARRTLRERFETESDRAFGYVESVRNERGGEREEQEAIWTLSGHGHVAERAAELVRNAEGRVVFAARTPDLVTDDIAAALREAAADDLTVRVVSVNPDVRELFADDASIATMDTAEPAVDDERTGRAVLADGDVVLLSVLGDRDDIPELTTETAFWTAQTNFATVLHELAMNSIAPRETA